MLKNIDSGEKVEWNSQNYISANLIQQSGDSLILASNRNKTDLIYFNPKNKSFNTLNINNKASVLNNFYFKADTAILFFNDGLAKINMAKQNLVFFTKINKSNNAVVDQLNRYQKISIVNDDIIIR